MQLKIKLILVCLTVSMCVYFYFQHREEGTAGEKRIVNFEEWTPSTAELKTAVLQKKGATPEQTDLRQKYQFGEMIQRRYRAHEMAIGFRMKKGNLIHIMVESRLEPWIIDKIASSCSREAHEVFGGNYQVEVFETYIGAQPALVALGKSSDSNPNVLVMKHQPPVIPRRKP